MAKQQTDPAGRAERAAKECQAATREAHEAIKGMREAAADQREAAADLRAALAETRHYVATVVHQEVTGLLEPAMQAAMSASVAKITKEFEAYAAARVTAAAEVAIADPLERISCPHCGTRCDGHTPPPFGSQSDTQPHKGAVSVCIICHEPSMFDIDATGKLMLRKPTLTESKSLTKSRIVRRVAKIGVDASE